MDTFLTGEMIKALTEGDIPRFMAYAAIFTFIWIEVRGLKKEFKKLNSTLVDGFAKGENRFSQIENRLDQLEGKQPKQSMGGLNEKTVIV
jgi:hypothetical protein